MRNALIALTVFAAMLAGDRAASAADLAANKKTVAEFYDAVLNKKDIELAKKYIGEAGYKQHNPTAPDGIEGLTGFVNFLKDKFPNNKSEIKRIIAEGDLVVVHVHAVREPGTRGNAIIDIFRLDDKGKVVEHWDVVQPIPENPQNKNGMF
ncbi:MAG TPA: ester cyclase [Xanthobacteraceae bacterium]|jgi:predicted SnoaL-like aldol condensation-catalyzing enzyme|nr:ester cyclase [Xanthobacteraceae bacterium]